MNSRGSFAFGLVGDFFSNLVSPNRAPQSHKLCFYILPPPIPGLTDLHGIINSKTVVRQELVPTIFAFLGDSEAEQAIQLTGLSVSSCPNSLTALRKLVNFAVKAFKASPPQNKFRVYFGGPMGQNPGKAYKRKTAGLTDNRTQIIRLIVFALTPTATAISHRLLFLYTAPPPSPPPPGLSALNGKINRKTVVRQELVPTTDAFLAIWKPSRRSSFRVCRFLRFLTVRRHS